MFENVIGNKKLICSLREDIKKAYLQVVEDLYENS